MILRDKIEKMNDLDIDRIIMTNDYGLEFDITNFITTLGFYESIFNPFIVGEMVLEDAQDLMTNLSIVGREKILVRFSTPAIDPEIREITLRVAGQKNKISPNKSRAYIVNLRLISEDYFTNQITKDSVSFKGKPHKIVEKIVSEYLPGNLQINEETADEEYKIVYPFQHPHCMITQIMTNATPKDSEDSENDAGFLFYETLDGLNFRCFNNLFKEDPIYTFTNANTIRASSDEDEFLMSTFFTEKITFKDTSNRVKQIENGAFASRTYFHDLSTKEWGEKTFDYSADNKVKKKSSEDKMFPVISDNQPENTNIQKVFFTPRHTNIQGEDYKANENHYETTNFANSNLSLYNDTEVEIAISGNSLLRAGQMVTLNVTKNEPDKKIIESGSDLNEEKSGKYLISSIHHRFFMVDGSYKTYVTLVRNFRGKPVPKQQQKVETT